MLIRLLVGLIIGALVGSVVAGVLVFGLQVVVWSALFAYPAGALTGALVGLFAGKPIWAGGAKIEAGLKATFGAILAVGLLFAIRRWMLGAIDLSAYGAGSGKVGDLPAISLPVIAALLGGFYGVDNTPEKETTGGGGKRLTEKQRVANYQPDSVDDDEARSARTLQR